MESKLLQKPYRNCVRERQVDSNCNRLHALSDKIAPLPNFACISRNQKTKCYDPAASGHAQFLPRASNEVLRQSSSGPTPINKRRNSAMGTLTLLKNGANQVFNVPALTLGAGNPVRPSRPSREQAVYSRPADSQNPQVRDRFRKGGRARPLVESSR
jgi:hypothetical protein